ncbi:hypothetical protein IWQ52_004403 [Labrenzia sp. EL_159]|nr:hypothetical protein [Labrenzia sp. EL_162]MBG6196867.1 hypothetical protein [Labrenzia sp. EL_159]
MTIVVGALGVLVILPTFVRVLEWYFTAIGLMLGTGATARRRLAELENSEWFIGRVNQTSRRANRTKQSNYISRLWAFLDRGKVWFFIYWALFTAIIFYGNGHSLSEFLALIPYALVSGLLAALCVMRLYTKGHFEEDDDLKKD